jgi:outer membrane protein assembly factor BamB
MYSNCFAKRTQIFFTCLVLTSLFCITAYAASANGDWPRWRGPNGNGISTESDWNPASLGNKTNILWKVSVGYGFSSISIADGYLYTMGSSGKEDVVYCLDADNGKAVWTFSYECGPGQYAGPKATPTVDDGRVYTLSQEGHLFCLSAKNGKMMWKAHLVKEFGARPPTWGFAGSPVVEGGLLILNAGAEGLALDKKSGKKVWGSTGVGGYAAPVLFDDQGRRFVAFFGQRALNGVDLLTGEQVWSYPWRTSYDVNAADPLITDSGIFISSNYRTGCALVDISGPNPRVSWKNGKFNSHFSSFVYIDGYIYGNDGAAFSDRGTFRCLEAKTGREMWAEDLGFGSLIAVDGKLVILNSRGDLIIAEATHQSYREISRAEGLIPRKCWNPPSFADGRIYSRNERGEVVCVDVRK